MYLVFMTFMSEPLVLAFGTPEEVNLGLEI